MTTDHTHDHDHKPAPEFVLTLGNPEADVTPALTDLEISVISRMGDLWGDICQIVGDGPTRDADLTELIGHVHGIQRTIMSQAAGRAYPGLFRRLGVLVETGDQR